MTSSSDSTEDMMRWAKQMFVCFSSGNAMKVENETGRVICDEIFSEKHVLYIWGDNSPHVKTWMKLEEVR